MILHRGVGKSATSFPGLLHFTLDSYLIMLSVKPSGIKYDFLILSMNWPGIKSWFFWPFLYVIHAAKIIKLEYEIMTIQRLLMIATCFRCVQMWSRQGYTDAFFSAVLARFPSHGKMSFLYAYFVRQRDAYPQSKDSKIEPQMWTLLFGFKGHFRFTMDWFGLFVGFYGISTHVGYLTPNPFLWK